jgi:hypothetical protein
MLARRRAALGQAGGGDGGRGRVVTRGEGKKPPRSPRSCRCPPSRCPTGRRTRTGTCATQCQSRSHPQMEARSPTTPPSTRLTHSNQNTIMRSPWRYVCCNVPMVGVGYLSTTPGLRRAEGFWPHSNVFRPRSCGPRFRKRRSKSHCRPIGRRQLHPPGPSRGRKGPADGGNPCTRPHRRPARPEPLCGSPRGPVN